MELEYVPVQVAMRREIARLSDEEAGRALKAILDYVATGEDVEPEGNAAFLYLALLRECDKICKIHEVRSAGGKAGGRGRPKKTKSEEIQQSESEQAQLNPEPEQKPEVRAPASFISDEEAAEIQRCAGRSETAGIPRHDGDDGDAKPACGGQRRGRSAGMCENRRGGRKAEHPIPQRRN